MSYPSGIDLQGALEGTSPYIGDKTVLTLKAAAAISIGQLVEVTADMTVNVPTTVNSKKLIGVALTAGVANGPISVLLKGIARVVPFSTMSAGDQYTNSGGTALTDNSSLNTTIMGTVLKGGTSAGTAIVTIG